MIRDGERRRASQIALILAVIIAVPLVAYAGPGHAETWNFTVGPVTCQFKGEHKQVNNRARGTTFDNNSNCSDLKVRTRAYFEDGIWESFWNQGSGNSVYTQGPVGSTALASLHQAENGWLGTWSAVQDAVHAWS